VGERGKPSFFVASFMELRPGLPKVKIATRGRMRRCSSVAFARSPPQRSSRGR
jgi:hypothetical protein